MRLGVQCALVRGRGRGIAAPGFVDLQVNGCAGVDLTRAGPEEWASAGAALLAAGTTAWRPTFITAPEAETVAALGAMSRAGHGPRTLGAHLEGPFLAVEHAGAHPVEHLRVPD
jgi:N-acetylglucosamine-6-phosphate deacetylase